MIDKDQRKEQFPPDEILAALNLHHQALIYTIPDIVYFKDIQCRNILVNKAFEELVGLKEAEIVGKTDDEIFPHDLAVHCRISDLEVMTTGKPVRLIEEATSKDGKKICFDTIKSPLFDSHGNLIGIIGISRDITEQKHNERQLGLFKTLVNQSSDAIFITDPATSRFLDVNIAACNTLGYSRNELLKMGAMDIEAVLPDHFSWDAHVKEVKRQGAMVLEGNHKRRDGTTFPVEVNVKYITQGGIEYMVAVARDITDRKKAEEEKIARLLEEEILKNQRLESLGILAGGIAHDFNNILTAILGNISFSKHFLKPEDEVYKMISESEKAAFRARDLTRQLLTFAKGGMPVKRALSINQVVRESAEFALRGSNIRCEYLISDGIKSVDADEGQISQVIHNLVINAIHAMPQGGVMTIRCENMKIVPADSLPLEEGDYVRISVEDTGIGIPEEHLHRIFDPYFTTKPTGSGLGLAMAYSIIKKHSGLIHVTSRSGKGTIFHIYLPASEQEVVSEFYDEKAPVFGKGKILVMDDEEMIRKLAGEILHYMGYRVELAVNGEEAIERYQKAMAVEEPFDLVIMDLTIPGAMGGKEAVRELLRINPAVKAVVSSGYSNDPILSDYQSYGFRGVIPKPYRVAELSRIIHDLIQEAN